MSKSIRTSALEPLELEARQAAQRKLRRDLPHAERHALRGPLAWTDYVQPSLGTSPLAATLQPEGCVWSACTAPDITAAEPCHVSRSVNWQPVLRSLSRDRDVRTGVRRQRFYPEQWRRLQQPMIDRLVQAHGQSLQWIGWQRSLPQLYLPAGHLTRVVMDLLQASLRLTPAEGALERSMCLRAGSQIGAMQAFVLVLEHPRLELSSPLMQYLNAPLTQPALVGREPPGAEELVRVRGLLKDIGGTILVSRARDGGTQFRVSVPADDRLTLVRAWLEQATHGAIPIEASAGEACKWLASESQPGSDIYQSQISMFVIGRRQAESVDALSRTDAGLQALSGRGDLVYRAARSRWLWLTMHSDLPPLDVRAGWQTQLVSRWNCLVEAALLNEQQTAAFHGLARAIAAKMDVVLGRRVPPLDALVGPVPRSRHLRADRAKSAQLAGPSQQPARVSLGVAATSSTAQRRWRYPI